MCTSLSNSIGFPNSVDLINPSACFLTSNLTDDNILETIRALDINRPHGYDEISVRMTKLLSLYLNL